MTDLDKERLLAERLRRRDETVAVVGQQYRPPRHRILKYAGKPLPKRLQPTSE